MKRLIALATCLLAFAPPALAQSAPERLSIQGETYYGVREIPGYDLTGTYLYEHEGDPTVVLNADGTGSFARHQRPNQPVTWWILADADGTAKVNKGEVGQQHTLVFRESDGAFDMNMLTIRYDTREIIILGERMKRY